MCATPSGSYLRRVYRRYKYLNPLGSCQCYKCANL